MTLPSPEVLASLVTNVTQTMFGMAFQLSAGEVPWSSAPTWRGVILPIAGKRPLQVAVASNDAGGQALSCAMFSCKAPDVDESMIKDSLAELANIVAGQVKSVMGLDQALGLPRHVSPEDMARCQWHSATLGDGQTQVRVWVAVTES